MPDNILSDHSMSAGWNCMVVVFHHG